MWHLWHDQIQGIGIEGGSNAILLPKLSPFVDFTMGLGRFGRHNEGRGDVGLAGELGPESPRRPEGLKGAKEGLILPIIKFACSTDGADL